MEYSFDIDLATQYGMAEACLIKNFQHWIRKNKANNKHCYDRHYWTYNSVKALSELFPFLTEKQIRRTLDSLVEKGVLIKGNYNKSSYDRTLWYAFKDESIFLNSKIDLPIWANGSDQKGEPIPDNKPYNKPYNKLIKEINRTSSINKESNQNDYQDDVNLEKTKKKRACRFENSEYYSNELPDSFSCEAELMAVSDSKARFEYDKFKDYWTAKSGQQATKLDWLATWRNWLRNMKPEDKKKLSREPLPEGEWSWEGTK